MIGKKCIGNCCTNLQAEEKKKKSKLLQNLTREIYVCLLLGFLQKNLVGFLFQLDFFFNFVAFWMIFSLNTLSWLRKILKVIV